MTPLDSGSSSGSNAGIIEPSFRSPAQSFKALSVYGIMGLLTLSTSQSHFTFFASYCSLDSYPPSLLAEYVVVITGRAPIRGRINSHTIYHATEFRVLPISAPTSNTMMDHPVEKHLVDLMEQHLATSVLWFSYGYDLTRNLQAQTLNPADNKPLWETVGTKHHSPLLLYLRY